MALADIGNIFDQTVKEIDATESDPARHLSVQIDAKLREAIRAAKSSGKAAKVTVELKVGPGPDRRVQLSGSVKASLPNPPTNQVTLYADEDGGIHRSDPAQLKLQMGAPVLRQIIEEEV